MNCFRFLDFSSLEQVERLTFREYRLLMKANALKRVDREREIYLQAWVNQQAKATKNKGKSPYFRSFKDFFDYEKRLKEVSGEKKKPANRYEHYRAFVKRQRDEKVQDQ